MTVGASPRPGDAMAAARRVLSEVFGFEAFRPGQEAVIETLLAGRNALAVMPTGSGKSLCFQVPALVMDGLTVVVSPLVALMQDQVAALRLAGVGADAIHSGDDRAGNEAAWHRATGGRTRLLYMAPERLIVVRRRRLTPWNRSESRPYHADRRLIHALNNTLRRPPVPAPRLGPAADRDPTLDALRIASRYRRPAWPPYRSPLARCRPAEDLIPYQPRSAAGNGRSDPIRALC